MKANVILLIFTILASEVKGGMRAGVMNGNKMSHMQVNCVNGPTVISIIKASILLITNISFSIDQSSLILLYVFYIRLSFYNCVYFTCYGVACILPVK